MSTPYEPERIEAKWQQVWADARAFEVGNDAGDGAAKSYVLEQLPYPSGSHHMGHMLVYTIGDVATHFRGRVDRYSLFNEPNWHSWLEVSPECRRGRWEAERG